QGELPNHDPQLEIIRAEIRIEIAFRVTGKFQDPEDVGNFPGVSVKDPVQRGVVRKFIEIRIRRRRFPEFSVFARAFPPRTFRSLLFRFLPESGGFGFQPLLRTFPRFRFRGRPTFGLADVRPVRIRPVGERSKKIDPSQG
ncbi:MAG: hypothetical protein ACYDH0_06685, partial [Candidatus Aminicenantales bacterium]